MEVSQKIMITNISLNHKKIQLKNVKYLLQMSLFIILMAIALHFLLTLSEVPDYIFPKPLSLVKCLFIHKFTLFKHSIISFKEALIGLFFAVILGILSSTICFFQKNVERILKPILFFFQLVPSFILMPLFLIWFGNGNILKICLVALSCYFPMLSCCLDGLQRTPSHILEQISLLKVSTFWTLTHIQFYYALPSFFSGLRLSCLHAPLCVLAVDWIGASSGLGYLIMLSHGNLQMDLLFLCLFCIFFLSFFLYRSVCFLEKKIIFWVETSS
jgi:putative hydroxymethylpyrimidine transport system permease protein